MADNEIVYEIKANSKPVEDALKKIDSSAATAGGSGSGLASLGAAISNLGPLAIAAATAISTYLVGKALKEGISAAIEQENAFNRMNNALNMAGRLSESASADMNNFSAQIQKTTTIADDAALEYIAIASAFTKTNEQARELTLAAINLSTAMGTSADMAVKSLGGSLGGMTGQLGKIIPEIKNLTEEQLKAGAAIDLVAAKFGGAAAAAANTFSGRLTQLKNGFGDVLEEIGFFFVKSDSLRKTFGFIAEAVANLAVKIGSFREQSGDVFQPLLLAGARVGEFFVNIFGPILEYTYNAVSLVIKAMGNLASIMQTLMSGDFTGIISQIDSAMSEAFDLDALLSTKGTDGANAYIASFVSQIQMANEAITASMPEGTLAPKFGPSEQEKEKVVEDLSMIGLAYDSLYFKIRDLNAKISNNWADLKKALFSTIVQGVGQAMNAVGQALVNGGNALAEFGKAVLRMFGELAMQLGMFWFLEGIVTMAGGDYGRGAAIMAGGLAMMAFGGVLQAMGGGGGSSAPSTSSAAGAGGTSGAGTIGVVGDNTTGLNDVADRERTTTINVNIAGNVLGDKRTLGIEIADALNEAFGNDGIIIARGAVS